jgi:hypothetical protein
MATNNDDLDIKIDDKDIFQNRSHSSDGSVTSPSGT